KRIIGKRPFLSRIDFEDFVASLLVGDPTDPNTPVGAIHFAIPKRIDHADDPSSSMRGEIRLSQFMEMSGLQEYDSVYHDCNTAVRMAQRFEYFLQDDKVDPNAPPNPNPMPNRINCMLTVKAFNN